MAVWVPRERADGGVSVQIRWRQDGRWQSETFSTVRLAVEFRTAVEAAGNRWPDGWIRGQGWGPDSRGAVLAPAPAADPGTVASGLPVTEVAAETAPTFADVATGENGYFRHQERRVKRGKLTLYTVHRDRRTYELHFEEPFGHLDFTRIDEHDITEWVDGELEDGAAPKSVRNWHGLLSAIMKHGRLRLKLRPDNPCELSELPDGDTARPEARQIRFFQQHEWALFRSFLADDVRLALDVDLATGLRWGELSALRVGDLTFTDDGFARQANLHVVRAWSRRSPDDPATIRTQEGETGRWLLGPPKSRRSRWVVVTGPVAERLEQHVRGHGRDAYVFVTPQGNPWRYPDFHFRRWTPAKDAARKAGLDKAITPHMLRHTTVVWSLASGVPIQVISEMIGHTSLQMTYDVYGGLVNLADPAMGRAMAQAMLGAATATTPTRLHDPARPQRAAGQPPHRGRRGVAS